MLILSELATEYCDETLFQPMKLKFTETLAALTEAVQQHVTNTRTKSLEYYETAKLQVF